MVFSALVIIFLFLKSWGPVPILRSIQHVTFKYGNFQKASRISLREPSLFINSIYGIDYPAILNLKKKNSVLVIFFRKLSFALINNKTSDKNVKL